jgi:hypothetical protein
MPNFDGTGPNGLGPAYGKGRGRCQNQGRRFGFRRAASCPFAEANIEQTAQEDTLETLKTYKRELEAKIEALEKKIK